MFSVRCGCLKDDSEMPCVLRYFKHKMSFRRLLYLVHGCPKDAPEIFCVY